VNRYFKALIGAGNHFLFATNLPGPCPHLAAALNKHQSVWAGYFVTCPAQAPIAFVNPWPGTAHPPPHCAAALPPLLTLPFVFGCNRQF